MSKELILQGGMSPHRGPTQLTVEKSGSGTIRIHVEDHFNKITVKLEPEKLTKLYNTLGRLLGD